MRPLQAHCLLGLGKLYRRIGRIDDARIALSAAITLLDEQQMALWLPEAKAELAEACFPALDRCRGGRRVQVAALNASAANAFARVTSANASATDRVKILSSPTISRRDTALSAAETWSRSRLSTPSWA
jgi:hypothetical protein